MNKFIKRAVMSLFLIVPISAQAIFTTNKVRVESPSSFKEYDLFAIDIQLAQLGINEALSPIITELFNEVNQAKNGLQNDLRAGLLTMPDIDRVNYAIVTTYPLQLNLNQASNSLFANINGLGVKVSGKVDSGVPLFCESASFYVSIQNIDVTLQYDLFSGTLGISSINYDLDTDTNCSGLLGFIGDLFAEPEFDDSVRDGLEDAVTGIEGTPQMQQLFSVRELTDELASIQVGSNTPAIQNTLLRVRDLLDGININTNISVGVELFREIDTQCEGPFCLSFTTNILTLRSNL
jgi:hypothetical protein